MISSPPVPSVFDTQSLGALKGGIRQNDAKALKAAAQQFEAVFLQMVLKSMRAAAPQTGPFESDQTRFFQEMLDSQLAQVMAAKGGMGLAAVIEKQLSRPDNVVPVEDAAGFPLLPDLPSLPLRDGRRFIPLPQIDTQPSGYPLRGTPVRPATSESGASAVTPAPSFVANVWPDAVAASQTTGIPAQFLVAHAALETGWGRAEPRYANGQPSYNLFGIKAGSQWQGPTVEATTTEYVNGVAEKRIERFRAYASYAESFQDYAQLLAQSPRYAAVIGSRDAASFAQGLQRAGYATDPAYATKLERVIASLAQWQPESQRA
jgi:flagellar protein FlgJ